jgi:hypothetical protein
MKDFAILAARKTPWEIVAPNLTVLVFGLLAFAAVIFLIFILA